MKTRSYCIVGTVCAILFILWMATSCSQLKNTPSAEIIQTNLSWEGELNPTEFGKWEVVLIVKEEPKYIYFIGKNPDELSPIPFVYFTYDKKAKIIREYYYFKDGEPYTFLHYDEIDQYRKAIMPKWKKEWCFSCHQNKKKIKGKEI